MGGPGRFSQKITEVNQTNGRVQGSRQRPWHVQRLCGRVHRGAGREVRGSQAEQNRESDAGRGQTVQALLAR